MIGTPTKLAIGGPITFLCGVVLVGAVLLARACASYLISEAPKTVFVTSVEREYSFAPETIRSALPRGEGNLFHLIRETRQPRNPATSVPVSAQTSTSQGNRISVWSQSDFESVLQGLLNQSGTQDSNSFQLQDIVFRVPCAYANIGPQWMSFKFIRAMTTNAEQHYLTRHLIINLDTGRAIWRDEDLIVTGMMWTALDRSNFRITAEVALQVGETKAGAAFRTKVDNACSIAGYLLAERSSQYWDVVYNATGGRSNGDLSIHVDTSTGQGIIGY